MAVVIGLHAYQGGPFASGGFGAGRDYPVNTTGDVAFTTVVSEGPNDLGGGQYAWGNYASYPTGPWWSWATLEPILNALVPAGTDPIWLHGHSEGAGVAAEALRNGWTAGGRLIGVVFDDPSDPWGPLSNPRNIRVVLYATTPDAGATWNVNTTNAPTVPTGVLEKYEAAFGVTRKRSDLYGGPTTHGPMTRIGTSGPYAPPELLDASFWQVGTAASTFAFHVRSLLRDADRNVLTDHTGAPLLQTGASGVPNIAVAHTGTATATWGFTATASGAATRGGTAAATWTFTGTAAGVPTTPGTAAATWTFTATAVADNVLTGAATATYAFTATAAGYRHVPSLQAAFTGTTINTTRWIVHGDATTQNNRLILPAQSTYDEYVESHESFMLFGSSLTVEVVAVPTGANTECGMQFGDDVNDVEFGLKGDQFFTRVTEDGVSFDNESLATFDLSTYRRWRILEDDGVLYFQTAPMTSGWTTLDSRPAPAWVYTNAYPVVLWTGWHTSATSPGNFEVDNLNLSAVGVYGTAAATWELEARHALRDENGDVVTALVPLTSDIDETLTDHLGNPLHEAQPVRVVGISGFVTEGATTGVAAVTWPFYSTVLGIRGRNGTAAATWNLTSTAVGAPNEFGTAAATFTFTASAAGVPDVAGVAAATWALTATAAGTVDHTATATATYAFTATAEGDVDHTGTATATWQFVGTAVAEPVKAGQLTATWDLTASAAGTRGVTGTAAATYTVTAAAAGESGTLGTATATWTFTGTAVGVTNPKGTATATWTFTAAAAGLSVTQAAAAATWTFTAAVIGVRDTPGTVSATWRFVGDVHVDPPAAPQRERTRIRRHRPSTSARRPRHATTVRRHST